MTMSRRQKENKTSQEQEFSNHLFKEQQKQCHGLHVVTKINLTALFTVNSMSELTR